MEGYFSPKKSSKLISSVLLLGIVVYIVCLLGSLIAATVQIRSLPINQGTTIAFGPLPLIHLQKAPGNGETFYLEFALRNGLIGLLVFSIVCSGLILWLLDKYHRKP